MVEILKAIIAERKIANVRFTGEINGAAKYAFLSSVDLYVLPSHTENFGVTVAEALACGTPVIASRHTPWGGVVENRCGWCVSNDVGTLAATLDEAMSLPQETLKGMGVRDVNGYAAISAGKKLGGRCCPPMNGCVEGARGRLA